VCGQWGCLETYASAAAVARRYAARGGTPGRSTPEIVALAAAGDPVAEAVWAEAVDALGTALAAYTMMLDPALVVIGGGLAEAGEALLAPLRGRLAARLAWREPPRVVRGALGSSAGPLGAAPLGAAVLAWRVVGHEIPPAPGEAAPAPGAGAPAPGAEAPRGGGAA
jgi:glucokinase